MTEYIINTLVFLFGYDFKSFWATLDWTDFMNLTKRDYLYCIMHVNTFVLDWYFFFLL